MATAVCKLAAPCSSIKRGAEVLCAREWSCEQEFVRVSDSKCVRPSIRLACVHAVCCCSCAIQACFGHDDRKRDCERASFWLGGGCLRL
eukprot:6180303-Pleurochrysis_carterae.AAC.1